MQKYNFENERGLSDLTESSNLGSSISNNVVDWLEQHADIRDARGAATGATAAILPELQLSGFGAHIDDATTHSEKRRTDGDHDTGPKPQSPDGDSTRPRKSNDDTTRPLTPAQGIETKPHPKQSEKDAEFNAEFLGSGIGAGLLKASALTEHLNQLSGNALGSGVGAGLFGASILKEHLTQLKNIVESLSPLQRLGGDVLSPIQGLGAKVLSPIRRLGGIPMGDGSKPAGAGPR